MRFKIGQIKIKASFFFFAAAAYFLSAEMCRNYLWALLFSSLHELGHLAALLYFRCPPSGVTVGAMGIRIEKSNSSLSYREECVTALCGPAVNLTGAFIFFALKKNSLFFELPFVINIGLFAVNMLPVRMLDGGRFLHALALMKTDLKNAEKLLNIAETVTLLLLIAILVFSLLADFVNTSFVLFVCGLAAVSVMSILSPKQQLI